MRIPEVQPKTFIRPITKKVASAKKADSAAKLGVIALGPGAYAVMIQEPNSVKTNNKIKAYGDSTLCDNVPYSVMAPDLYSC